MKLRLRPFNLKDFNSIPRDFHAINLFSYLQLQTSIFSRIIPPPRDLFRNDGSTDWCYFEVRFRVFDVKSVSQKCDLLITVQNCILASLLLLQYAKFLP